MRVRRIIDVTIVLNLIVVLMGAVVRATGSGAGCGRSWPTCQGELIPALEGATAIEFAHRALSGLALVAVAWLIVVVFRTTDRGAPLRWGASVVGVSIAIEALIGMTIVLAEWVAEDASLARAVSVPIHLVSTLVLLGGLVVTRFLAVRPHTRRRRGSRSDRWWIFGIGAGLVLVAATGAVTALADTLFPKDFEVSTVMSAGEHFLTRLRVVHPIIAAGVGLAAAFDAGRHMGADDDGRLPARIIVGAVLVEIVLGSVNVAFGTPLAVSLLHLLVADVVWMAWVWLAMTRLTVPTRNTESVLGVAPGL